MQTKSNLYDSISFPVYDGSYDPSVWIKNVNSYFSFHHTPIGHRVETASFHLQGRALDWFWTLLASRSAVSWSDFVEELHSYFGSATLATIDHMGFKSSSPPAAATIKTVDFFGAGAQSRHDPQTSIDAAFAPLFKWISAMEVRTQLADHSEISHEKDSLDLDSGLPEFGDCFPTHRGNQEPEIPFHNSRNFDLNMTQFESFPEISQNNENLSSSESSSTIPSGTLTRPHASTIVHPTSAKEADFLDLQGGQTSLGKPELPKFSVKHSQEEDNGVDAMGEKLEHSGRNKAFTRINAEEEGHSVPLMNDNIQANDMNLVVTGKHTGRKEVNTVADGHVIVLEKSCSLSESSDESLKKDQTLSAEMDNPIFTAAESLIQISSRNTESTSDKVADVGQMEVANEERSDEPQTSSDSFESMVLMLTETANDECSMPARLPEEETGKGKCRFNLRKGRGQCDFQRDILPGLVSLSRQEICEDLHAILEAVRLHELAHGSKKPSKGIWFTPTRSRPSRVGKRQ